MYVLLQVICSGTLLFKIRKSWSSNTIAIENISQDGAAANGAAGNGAAANGAA